MKKINLNAKARVTDVDYCKENPSFYRGVVRILTSNVVANRTLFTDKAIENAIPSLVNIPLVALYKEEEQTLGGHEVEFTISKEEGLEISYGTHPIGIIPESANIWFDNVIENGVQRRYLCAEVLLWKREKVYRLFKKKRSFGVSMEVQILNRNKQEDYDEITDFYFTAIAVLGSEAPAFKSANIKVFSEEDTFQQMLHDLKEYMEYSLTERGEDMEDTLKLETDKVEETVEPTTEEQTEVVEETVETVEETVETVEETEPVVEEVATEMPVEAPVVEPVEPVVYADEDDKDGDKEDVEDVKEDKEEEKEEDEVEDTQALYYDLQVEYGRLSEELAVKTQAFNELVATHEQLQASYEELVVFKQTVELERRNQAEEELFARFSDLSEDEGFETLKTHAKDFSLQELETQLYAMAGKRLFSAKQTKQKEGHSVVLETARETKPMSAFSILDKFL